MTKRAFTLAEVLITLGIIGVVASLTMPALTASYQKKVTVTRLQKFYSVMNQAVTLSEVENGSAAGWKYPDTTVSGTQEFFDTYLAPYMKVVKQTTVKNTSGVDRFCVVLADGSSLLMVGNSGLLDAWFFINSVCDLNRSDRRERFGWQLSDGKVKLYDYSWDGTREDLLNNPKYGCVSGTYHNFCARLIQYDGWEIKDDYGW